MHPGPAERYPGAGSPGVDADAVIDPDVDLHNASQAAETRRHQWDVLATIGAGGVLGAEARYGLGLALPHTTSQFPWSTLIINATGSFAIGALMVLLLELTSPHRLARPFLGVGVLGGYTTFSTFSVEVERLIDAHRPLTAVMYIGTTVLACLLAVWTGTILTQLTGRMLVDVRTRT